jgi:hypothetical protein
MAALMAARVRVAPTVARTVALMAARASTMAVRTAAPEY